MRVGHQNRLRLSQRAPHSIQHLSSMRDNFGSCQRSHVTRSLCNAVAAWDESQLREPATLLDEPSPTDYSRAADLGVHPLMLLA